MKTPSFLKRKKKTDAPAFIIYAEVSRAERVILELDADVKADNREFLENAARKLEMVLPPFAIGDTVSLSYSFDINYLAGIEERLSIIVDLCGRDDIVFTCLNIKELHHGKILIKEMFDKLGELQRKIEERKQVTGGN